MTSDAEPPGPSDPTPGVPAPAAPSDPTPGVPAPWTPPTPGDGWVPDVLGPDYRARALPLEEDAEGEVVATLVRYAPPTDEPVLPARAVLYLHGWNDYFFQTHVAEYWHRQHVAFYALDLRKYGRSLRPHQTPNYVTDLATYDEEIDAALAVVRAELGQRVRVMVMGHSTGGLVASLWADRHPGQLTSLLLNSPWLELAGASFARSLATPLIATLARTQPTAPLPNIDPGFNARSVLATMGGEWSYDEAWRPNPMFPVRPAWLQAILLGHARVARGLSVDVPVLVGASATSVLAPRWHDDMRAADSVLDVEIVARRAVQLGPLVTVLRVPGGQHDLTLSAPAAREHFFTEVTRWAATYGWG